MYFCPYNSILLIKHQYNKLWCNEIRDIANYFQIPSVASTTLQITGYNEITDTMNAVRVLVDYVTSRFYSTAEAEAGWTLTGVNCGICYSNEKAFELMKEGG